MSVHRFGQDWFDPLVEAELAKPRGRGRPPNRDRALWDASLRLHPNRRQPECTSINAEVLQGAREELVVMRRQILKAHRGDRRSEERDERRALIAGLLNRWEGKSAASVSTWLSRNVSAFRCVSERTLWADVVAIRRSRSGSPSRNS